MEKHLLEELCGVAEAGEASGESVVDGGIDVERSGRGERDCCILVGLPDDLPGQEDAIEHDSVSLKDEDVLLGGE